MKVNFSDVNRALFEHGFLNTNNFKGSVTYSGSLHIASKGEDIPVTVVFLDRKMKKPPIIKLESRPDWVPRVCPNLSADGQLCYIDTNRAYLPRWEYPGAVIACIQAAEALLNKIANGEVEEGIRDEFLVFWEGSPLLVDIPGLNGSQEFKDLGFFNVPLSENRSLEIIGVNREYLEKGYGITTPEMHVRTISLYATDIDIPLGSIQGEWPPKNLYDFITWARELSPKIESSVKKALSDIYEKRMPQSLVLVKGTNCSCAVSIIRNKEILSFRKYKNGREFARRILSSTDLLRKTKAIRFSPIPVDPRSWLTRNTQGGHVGLAGRNILVLGCGSVGGYLCDMIAKMGAGQLGGELTLSDNDILLPGNLGRHILGFSETGKNKSKSLCEKLESMYPHINVKSSDDTQIENETIDLIIDATGSKEMSHYLNELKVSEEIQADIIFTWVAGDGIGSQALFTPGKNYACLKCLDNERPGANHSILRKGHAPLFIEGSGGCGDWLVPFDVTAAVHSASLAAKMALDWAKGSAKPNFRSVLINQKMGKNVKDGSPLPNSQCVICSL